MTTLINIVPIILLLFTNVVIVRAKPPRIRQETSSSSVTDSASATASATASDSTTITTSASASSSVTDSVTATATATSNSTSDSADLTVVKFAALTESLEKTFYETALQKFGAQSFVDAGFVDGQLVFDQLSVILSDESTHLSTLQSVAQTLGGDTSSVDSCQFNFDSALTDVNTFLATARVLEFVGIDAYIGGTTLIEDKSLLVSAAEITTVEARHNTVLNAFNSGSSISNAFDMVLSPQQVLSVAAPFISGGCDPVAALGLTPTPALTITNNGTASPGTLLTFGGAGLDGLDQSTLFCNMIVGGATQSLNFPMGQCVVPSGIDGAVHLFITNSSTPFSSNILNQDASVLVAGPAVTFIDTIANAQSELLLGTDNNVTSTSASSSTNKNNNGNNNNGQTVVITKIVVEGIQEQMGIKRKATGGQGAAIALGWI